VKNSIPTGKEASLPWVGNHDRNPGRKCEGPSPEEHVLQLEKCREQPIDETIYSRNPHNQTPGKPQRPMMTVLHATQALLSLALVVPTTHSLHLEKSINSFPATTWQMILDRHPTFRPGQMVCALDDETARLPNLAQSIS
jgi:hypothetical protein